MNPHDPFGPRTDSASTFDPDAIRLVCAPVIASRLSPAFDGPLRELEALYGDELTDDVVLGELRDYLADLVFAGTDEDAIEACCATIELLATTPGVDPVCDLYDLLLGRLAPIVLERLLPYLSEETARLVDTAGRPSCAERPATGDPLEPEDRFSSP